MAAVNRPQTPHQPRGDPHFHATSGVPNTGQQYPGPQTSGQDPGGTPHPMSARPVFYVHAPPAPPFLHYQWPMPFYNPFAGFPSMGYGVVMPQFPPPPYMEAPASYIMPHPHVQPVDFRRFLNPVVHPHGPLYQNLNQTRRVRVPYTVPVRETVNSEVQTEPPQATLDSNGKGRLLVGSDSGRGTASCSPSSSSCSSQKQGSEVEKYTSPSSCVDKEIQVTSPCKQAFVSHPDKSNRAVKLCCERLDQNRFVDMDSQKTGRGNVWSVSSQDCIVPVCSSSQQEDEVVKERRPSVPDILVCWDSTTPQNVSGNLLPHEDQQSSRCDEDYEGPVYQSTTETKRVPALGDDHCTNSAEGTSDRKSDTLHEVLLESRRQSRALGLHNSENPTDLQSQVGHSFTKVCGVGGNEDNCATFPHNDTTESIHWRSTSQMRKKMNESVWSVESLAPFIPNKEWILQNGMIGPEMIAELNEDPEKDGPSTQKDFFKSDNKRVLRLSSSDSAPMSDSWLVFCTPGDQTKKPQTPKTPETPGLQSMAPLENEAPVCLQVKVTPPRTDVGENGSSEPVANPSPNQELCMIEQQAGSPCSAGQEKWSSNPLAGDKVPPTAQWTLDKSEVVKPDNGENGSKDNCQLRNHQLCVPVTDPRMAALSPSSIAHCLFIGFHCNTLHEAKCPYEKLKPNMGQKAKHPDIRKYKNGKTEGGSKNGRMQKNQKKFTSWRNKRHGGDGENKC
ncbi:bucky ball [Dunckerocampus dactyliophorus]|uniref:bucky ball n=1 Tax=Dunckerocampus dactyliophorus TaxID=161453 RepID=UPI0024065893|nr:bucky ball [Dunckerocampus dactyliophorus]